MTGKGGRMQTPAQARMGKSAFFGGAQGGKSSGAQGGKSSDAQKSGSGAQRGGSGGGGMQGGGPGAGAAAAQPHVNENYLAYVRSLAPPTKHFHNCLRAFIVGGLICCVGQFFRYEFEAIFGLAGDELAAAVSVALIFLGCLLTGLGVYDRIGKAAGAGSIVPITGFANSVASPALEFKAEGMITGMAAKMFVVAGPIIVFGVLSGAAVGFLYYLLNL